MAASAIASPRNHPYTHAEMAEELGLLQKHRGNIYDAYRVNPDLFRKTVPYISRVLLDGDHLTDLQASVILPLLTRSTQFDLSRCAHLTGRALRYVPDTAQTILCPPSTRCEDLKNLTGRKNLKFVFVDHFEDPDRTDGIESLHEIALERLQIPVPRTNFFRYLPSTLTILDLHGGEVSDQALNGYLQSESAMNLTALYLNRVTKVTATAFKDLARYPSCIQVLSCPDIHKGQFLEFTRHEGVKASHNTEEEVNHSKAVWRRVLGEQSRKSRVLQEGKVD